MASLRKAHDVGCWGSELDIWLTSDGGLVVNHDPKTLDGLKIEETDFKTITKSKLKNGETVPSFKDYLKAGKKLKPMILVLELKTQSTPERNIELAKKVVDMVKSMKMEGQVEYIAFGSNRIISVPTKLLNAMYSTCPSIFIDLTISTTFLANSIFLSGVDWVLSSSTNIMGFNFFPAFK